MRNVPLIDGSAIAAIGQGTWRMGESADRWDEELDALRCGIDLGLTLIDTAEIYGNGRAERLVAEAIAGRRDAVTLVSKVAPSHAGREGTVRACEASLKRLKCERIDIYLLHWRGLTPLGETVEAFEQLKRDGKIGHWGLSNFDRDDLEAWLGETGATMPVVNQLFYSLEERGIEYQFMDWMVERDVAVMAYTPFGQRDLLAHSVLAQVAERHGATPAQIALAFLIRNGRVAAIPKASSRAHVQENAGAIDLRLDEDDLAALDAAFPPPRRKKPLAII